MSLVMRIRSLFDGSGAKAAADAQKELAAKSKTASDATAAGSKILQQAGQVASRAAEQISTVATAMGNTGGAAGQAAAGVRLLSGAIQTLTTAGGGLKGLLAAVALLATSALVNWLVKTAAKTKELNEQAGKTNDALTAMSKITLDAINAQQEKMRKTASDTADQYERILQAKNRMASAQEQADLAQLELDKAVDISRASKSDPFAARRIEAEYAAKAAAVSAEAERQRQNNQVAVAESKVKALREQAALADNEVNQKTALQSHDQQRLEEMKRGLNVSSLSDDERKKLTDQIGELEASIKDVAKAIEDAKARGDAARSQLPSAELDVLTERTVRAGNDIRNRAQGVQDRNAMAGIDYDQSEAAKEAARQLRAKEKAWRERGEGESDLQSRFINEANDVRKIDNGMAKGDRNKEIRERDAALKALQEYRKDSVDFYAELRAEMEKLREAIRNNPAQNS